MFQTVAKLEAHIKSLEKIEYEMLQKVFNMFVSIPEKLAINIPGLRDPSSLPHLKKVRQKIKNKLKVAKAQLKNQQKMPKVECSSVFDDIFVATDKDESHVNRISENSCDDIHIVNAEKLCFSNKLKKTSQIKPLLTQNKVKNLPCTVTSIKNNSEENNYKPDISSNLYCQKSTSSIQTTNECMYNLYNLSLYFEITNKHLKNFMLFFSNKCLYKSTDSNRSSKYQP